MSTPDFCKLNEDYLEIQLSNKNLSNETLFFRIGQLEEHLQGLQAGNNVKLDLDLRENPNITDNDHEIDGFGRLVLFLKDFGPSVKRLRIGGTGISGRGLCQLAEFIKLGSAEELDFSGLPSVAEDDVMALLMAVKECEQYPLNKSLPLFLRLDRNGLENPHHILAMVGDDMCCEVLSDPAEVQKALQRRLAAPGRPAVSPTEVMISLPFFYMQQETEDIVTTPPPMTPPTAPATPPDKPMLNLKAKAPAPPPPPVELEEIKLEEEEEAPAGSLPKAFRGSANAKKATQLGNAIIPLVKPKRPDHDPPLHLLWQAMGSSQKAYESMEVEIKKSTRAKAWSVEEESKKSSRAKAWTRNEPPLTSFSFTRPGSSSSSPFGASPPPNKRPKPSSFSTALQATPVPPPMPPPSWSRGETSLPALPAPPPPPPKPMPISKRPISEEVEAASAKQPTVISKLLSEVVAKGGSISKAAQNECAEQIQKNSKTSNVRPTSSQVRTVPSPQKKQAIADAAQEYDSWRSEDDQAPFKASKEEEWQRNGWEEWKGNWYKWDNQAKTYQMWEESHEEKDWHRAGWYHKTTEEWARSDEDQAWSKTEVKEEWKEAWKESRTERKASWKTWDDQKWDDQKADWNAWDKEEVKEEEDWSKHTWASDKANWKGYEESDWKATKGYQSWKASSEEEEKPGSTSASSHQVADAEEKPKAEPMDQMEEIRTTQESEPDEGAEEKIGGYVALLHKLQKFEEYDWEDLPMEKKLEELNPTNPREYKEKTSSEEGSEEEASSAVKPSSVFSMKDEDEDEDMADGPSRSDAANEDLIKNTRETIQRLRGEGGRRGLKRSRSPQEPNYPPPRKGRGPPGRRSGPKRPKSGRRGRHVDDSRQLVTVPLEELFFSQRSCKDKFQCGRSVEQLVEDLMSGEVDLNASFLRLTVFETRDEKSRQTVLRCIDNRRLLALKEYAKKIGKPNLRVNVSLFDEYTLTQVSRFFQNSDDTDGREVRLRKSRNDKRQAA